MEYLPYMPFHYEHIPEAVHLHFHAFELLTVYWQIILTFYWTCRE